MRVCVRWRLSASIAVVVGIVVTHGHAMNCREPMGKVSVLVVCFSVRPRAYLYGSHFGPDACTPCMAWRPLLSSWRLLVERVSLGRHDEVVAVQAPDLVCPPRHRHLAPLRQDRWMVPLGLSQLPYRVRELQRIRERSE